MNTPQPVGRWQMRTGAESAEERILAVAAESPPGVVALFRWVTRLGDYGPVWAGVAGAAMLRSVQLRRVTPLACALGTLAAGGAARAVLAKRLNRARPPEQWWRMEWSGPSLPSRHTTIATLGAGLVAGCLTPTRPGIARLVRWGPSVGVGLSRVVLGVHWPTDVVAGWLFAIGVLTASRRLRAAAGIA